MNPKFAVVCVFGGVPVAAVDVWTSMQAMFGLLNPHNGLEYAVTIFGGLFFTAFIVLCEASGKRRDWFTHAGSKFFGVALWLILFLVDTGTSILCIIWYGLLGFPFSTRIDISSLTLKFSNWPLTSIYVAFVLAAIANCIVLGRAFETLLEKS